MVVSDARLVHVWWCLVMSYGVRSMSDACLMVSRAYLVHVWWCLVVFGTCLVVSGACLVVSDGAWSMSGGAWVCLVLFGGV